MSIRLFGAVCSIVIAKNAYNSNDPVRNHYDNYAKHPEFCNHQVVHSKSLFVTLIYESLIMYFWIINEITKTKAITQTASISIVQNMTFSSGVSHSGCIVAWSKITRCAISKNYVCTQSHHKGHCQHYVSIWQLRSIKSLWKSSKCPQHVCAPCCPNCKSRS